MLGLRAMMKEQTTAGSYEILDGARVAEDIKNEVAADVAQLRDRHGIKLCLAIVQVGDDPASSVYVRQKLRVAETIGIRAEHHKLDAGINTKSLLQVVEMLNTRDDVDGILVQLPLPKQIDENQILQAVNPLKDVDGFHPVNVGLLALGQTALAPCTPAGIIELLKRSNVELRGAHAVVIGRSQIVGRPLAQLLLQQDATVTICHSRTENLTAITRLADILIAAIGRPAFVTREYIKPGAIIVDVGINKVDDPETARTLFGTRSAERIEIIRKRGYTLVGDVHPAQAEEIAARLTPVPGGVGPLTVAQLMRNTVKAAMMRRKVMSDE
jgi:methylenetetrahydrofolate dehydrogenase (NADP+) / methenyltetrahydrofolate cyclohydrolase